MTDADDRRFMQAALDACQAGIEAGQSPFGACIVRDGQVLVAAHNHVRLTSDATAHAEVHAIRYVCGEVHDVHLPGATIYTTTEPCPMCFAAIHWARIERIVYGATIADATRFGFNELPITNDQLKQLGGCKVEITPSFMRPEALSLFRQWRDRGGKPY